ncbi:hypothetical protein V8G54_016526 [Vigna mungo]|uniref:Uncharacterized protein n=1 Tax=Vigna mungo TaxID=3915 RepID=A0AAQ3NLB0_VIGMU
MSMLDQVMSVSKGATDGISSVSKQVNTSVRQNSSASSFNHAVITMLLLLFSSVAFGKMSLSHVLYRLGCWELRVFRARLDMELVFAMVLDLEPMTKMTGLVPGLPPFGQGALPMPASSKNDQVSSESMMKSVTKSADQISAGRSMMQQATKSFDQISQESLLQLANKSVHQLSQGLVGSQPTKIGSAIDSQTEKAGLMQSENELLQTVMKQRQIIDELREENEKLCQILQVKDLKIPCSKLPPSSSGELR